MKRQGLWIKALSQPIPTDAYNNIGNALKDQGKLDEAKRLSQKALSLKPAMIAYHQHGQSNSGIQVMFEEAMEVTKRLLSSLIMQKPITTWARGCRIKLCSNCCAMKHTTKLKLAIKPDSAEVLFNTGQRQDPEFSKCC